jgi:transposase
VPAGLTLRLTRLWAQLELLNAQLKELTRTRAGLPADPATTTGRYVERLPTLRGIGPVGAWVLATELFGWLEIRTARQLGALVGLVPAPYQSGVVPPRRAPPRIGVRRSLESSYTREAASAACVRPRIVIRAVEGTTVALRAWRLREPRFGRGARFGASLDVSL